MVDAILLFIFNIIKHIFRALAQFLTLDEVQAPYSRWIVPQILGSGDIPQLHKTMSDRNHPLIPESKIIVFIQTNRTRMPLITRIRTDLRFLFLIFPFFHELFQKAITPII